MILVTGATGHLGRLTIEALLKLVKPDQIAAGVRDFGKAQDLKRLGVQLREADYNRPESWTTALKGVTKLILISSSEVGQRVRQHQTVIDAAKTAGSVELIVYTSILHAPTSTLSLATEHRTTEAAIVASGLPHVFLRNGWYIENYQNAIEQGTAAGVIYGAAREGRIAAAPRADYAEALAKVVTMKDHSKSVYELAGDVGFTMAELAIAVGKVAGKPVKYTDLAEGDYRDLLIRAGLPAPIAAMLANADAGIAKGALADEGHDLRALLGRPTTALLDVIRTTNHPSAH